MHSDEELLRDEVAVPPQSFNPTAMSRVKGRPVICSPEQLRLHRALEELGWTGEIDEFNDAARPTNPSVTEPILITTNGTILAGFGRWRSAIFDGRQEINCIEYPLSEDDSLQFIISYHQPRRVWNAFIRIRLALKLEPHFQQRALDNMRVGGKYKGSANLPEADRIDVRQEIAKVAGTGTGNVSKVKAIMQSTHPNIIVALQDGLLRIHRAWQWCKLPKLKQKEEFARYEEARFRGKIVREFSVEHPNVSLDPAQIIEVLQREEARQPGLIAIRTSRSRRTVVVLGQDLLTKLDTQKELNSLA
jgi:hypothetical protein